jgi:ankyrin repeat protein
MKKEEMMKKMFFEAIEEGNEHDIIALLRIGISPNVQTKSGWTALMWAMNRGNEKCVEMLLNHPKIDVNVQNEWGMTALMLAAKEGKEKCVKLLLNHPGIDVYMQRKDGWTALMDAARWGHKKCVELIKRHIKNKEEAMRSLIQVEMNNAIADLLES